ncbi:MAG: transglycosylase SLT domain-containing protein [Myxococcota bacterium]|nr:transglycosylase SLT domain-containing protein [Myxococcota bacterium]
MFSLSFILPALLSLTPPTAATPVRPGELGDNPQAKAVSQAEVYLAEQDIERAQTLLAALETPAATVLKVRAARLAEEYERAQTLINGASQFAEPFRTLITLEKALVAQGLKDHRTTWDTLLPLIQAQHPVVSAHIEMAARAAARISPDTLLAHFDDLRAAAPKTSHARSFLLGELAAAKRAKGLHQQAAKLELKRFIEEPLGRSSPRKMPVGARITFSNLLDRAQKILDAHLNETALKALDQIPYNRLEVAQKCQWLFIHGMAHRKLHHYGDAEKSLMKAAKLCTDPSMRRRAAYVGVKVISIRSGLRAIEPIEAFVREFSGHSMVDDVLFWAGDLYQRRDRESDAIGYYQRIQKLPVLGDHCAEASWRQAWMAFRAGRLPEARDVLAASIKRANCTKKSDDRARALYWLGRVEGKLNQPQKAMGYYRQVIEQRALSYYAQLALTRLKELKAPKLGALLGELKAPSKKHNVALCPGSLADSSSFQSGLTLLDAGLTRDAARFFLRTPKHAEPSTSATCTGPEPGVLLALLLDQAGEHREAHWRLRTAFSRLIHKKPTEHEGLVLRAAYPLAFRKELGASESEHAIPSLFLQALAREESAFDPAIVSWAGAYGLTQLRLTTAHGAGTLVTPRVQITKTTQLLDPALNARLGGAFLSSLIKRFDGSLGLALCGYNAALKTATTWWHRHAGEPFDVFAEELTIRETRKYVKRVHQTWGIYRWLYEGTDPSLPIGPIPSSPKKS